MRRLSRRVLTDKVLKDQADRYLRRYFDLLQGSIEKDPAVVNTLLGSDPGRAYLPGQGLETVAEYDVPTTKELEDQTQRRAVLYRLSP